MIDGDSLTVMQKHILKFILLETLHREIYQKDIEEEFQIRKSTVTGILQLMEKRIYLPRKCWKRCQTQTDCAYQKAEALRPSILYHINESEAQMTQGISKRCGSLQAGAPANVTKPFWK